MRLSPPGMGLSLVTEISEDDPFETMEVEGERGLRCCHCWWFDVEGFSARVGSSSSSDSSESLFNKASVTSSLLVNVCF